MKNRFCLTAVLCLFLMAAIPVSSFATDKTKDKDPVEKMTKEQKDARLAEIQNRVYEIKAMDRSSMSREDKKALRKELKGMNREARHISGGVYISASAIIVILLVLLLI